MLRFLYCIFFFVLCALEGVAQTEDPFLIKYHPDSVKADFAGLFEELRDSHPGFYRYNDSSAFDAHIDSVIQQIDQELTLFEIYRIFKPIIARIGCLHTSLHLTEDLVKTLDAEANCIPLLLSFDAEGTIVLDNLGEDDRIAPGDQILQIDGRDMQDIFAELRAAIPLDGYSSAGKRTLLQYQFPGWYRNMIAVKSEFKITVQRATNTEVLTIQAVKSDQVPGYEAVMGIPMSMQIEGQVATLRIPSFSKSALKRQGQRFEKELKRYFIEMEEQQVQHLVVDLRGNSGGSDSHAAHFTASFFETPFRYWDRIVVTEKIAKQIKGLYRLFFKKPVLLENSWHWQKAGWFTREFDFYEEQRPSKKPFTGSLYLLTDGLCMSSCADVVSILQHHDKAIIVGEETGGGYQGNTSGIMPDEEIGYGLEVTVPLLKYVNAVDPAVQVGRGALPDYVVQTTAADLLEGKDPVMERVMELISAHTENPDMID